MAQINQKAVKCLSKLISEGFDTEKAVLAMTMDEILSIPGITVAEISLINEIQKAVKANKVFSFLAGTDKEQKTEDIGVDEYEILSISEDVVRLRNYNEKFNAIRPREYDGSHLNFYGMNPEIQLRQHQKNGVARIIYGGNTLLAYVVGAGKTYTMVAAAMECKRLGLCNKSMIVVPNHIIDQFAAEWLQLYPSANLLVATKKDFETKNRKKFCARIATSEIDAVIIGHGNRVRRTCGTGAKWYGQSDRRQYAFNYQ